MPHDVVKDADVMVLLTERNQLRALDLDQVKSLMRSPVVVDPRNVYRPGDTHQRGFTYTSSGRP